MKNYDWLASEDLVALNIPSEYLSAGEQRVWVRDAGARWAALVAIDEIGAVTVNGELIQLGDDYPAILGIFDAVKEEVGEVFLPTE